MENPWRGLTKTKNKVDIAIIWGNRYWKPSDLFLGPLYFSLKLPTQAYADFCETENIFQKQKVCRVGARPK